MCFSATASFTSAVFLSIIGAVALLKIKNKKQLMFALIPSLFALQQASEGVVWLSLQHTNYAWLQNSATHIFLIFALVLWPTWIPISVWSLEHNEEAKDILSLFIIFGAFISIYLAGILALNTVIPHIMHNNIAYIWNLPYHFKWSFLIYLIPVTIPFLISTIRYLWILGISIAASLLISYLFWRYALTSVWCFFVAILSMMVILFLNGFKRHS